MCMFWNKQMPNEKCAWCSFGGTWINPGLGSGFDFVQIRVYRKLSC